jgi:methionyl-tRNA formyltransferase
VTPERLRIVFFGTPAFAVPTLAKLIASPHEVVGVVTQPDRPRGRGQRVSPAPVKALAVAQGIAVLQPERLTRDAFHEAFSALAADLGVVAAYGKILPEWLIQMPALGLINVHASLLPAYRGAAPVHRAIMAGETRTGITIMRVVKQLDAGPMIARAERPVGADETSDVVERDLAEIGAELLVSVLDPLARGDLREVPQDPDAASYAPRLTKEEGHLDFGRPAREVYNRIRGLRPWPGAHTFLRDLRLGVHHARISPRAVPSGAGAGVCVAADAEGISVMCGDGVAIDLLQVQPEGRRVMAAHDFLAGHRTLAGERFG